MDNGDRVLEWLSLILVVGLTLYWVTQVVGSLWKRKWNDFCYALSILWIMWSGLDLYTAIVALLAVIGVYWWCDQIEAKEKDSGDI